MALTRQDQKIARAMAQYGHKSAVAGATGTERAVVSRTLAKPHVIAEVKRIQEQRLATDALPIAIDCLVATMQDPTAPHGSRVQAAKVVLDRTLGVGPEHGVGLDLSDMTPDQLTAMLAQLQQRLARGDATDVIDVTPVSASDELLL